MTHNTQYKIYKTLENGKVKLHFATINNYNPYDVINTQIYDNSNSLILFNSLGSKKVNHNDSIIHSGNKFNIKQLKEIIKYSPIDNYSFKKSINIGSEKEQKYINISYSINKFDCFNILSCSPMFYNRLICLLQDDLFNFLDEKDKIIINNFKLSYKQENQIVSLQGVDKEINLKDLIILIHSKKTITKEKENPNIEERQNETDNKNDDSVPYWVKNSICQIVWNMIDSASQTVNTWFSNFEKDIPLIESFNEFDKNEFLEVVDKNKLNIYSTDYFENVKAKVKPETYMKIEKDFKDTNELKLLKTSKFSDSLMTTQSILFKFVPKTARFFQYLFNSQLNKQQSCLEWIHFLRMLSYKYNNLNANIEYMTIFKGEQGIGKSYLGNYLIPRLLFSNGENSYDVYKKVNNDIDTNFNSGHTNKLFVNFEEIEKSKKGLVNYLKDFINAKHHQMRQKYKEEVSVLNKGLYMFCDNESIWNIVKGEEIGRRYLVLDLYNKGHKEAKQEVLGDKSIVNSPCNIILNEELDIFRYILSLNKFWDVKTINEELTSKSYIPNLTYYVESNDIAKNKIGEKKQDDIIAIFTTFLKAIENTNLPDWIKKGESNNAQNGKKCYYEINTKDNSTNLINDFEEEYKKLTGNNLNIDFKNPNKMTVNEFSKKYFKNKYNDYNSMIKSVGFIKHTVTGGVNYIRLYGKDNEEIKRNLKQLIEKNNY